MGLRGQLGLLGEGDLGATAIVGDGEGLDEALRGAGDEGQLDVDPVRAGGVVDDGPALQGRGLRGRLGEAGVGCVGEEDAVGGLPDGDLREVGDLQAAGAGSYIGEGKATQALVAVGVEELEIVVDVGVEGGIEEAYLGGAGELEGANGAGVGDDGEEGPLDDGGGLSSLLGGISGLEVEEAAGEDGAGAGDLDAGATDGGVEVRGGNDAAVLAEAEGEGLELLVERGSGVVVGSGDAAAVAVDGSEGLEDVVELGSGEGDGDGLVAGDAAGVFEEAYAVFVEGDVRDGELVGLRYCLRLGGCDGGVRLGLGGGTDGEKKAEESRDRGDAHGHDLSYGWGAIAA